MYNNWSQRINNWIASRQTTLASSIYYRKFSGLFCFNVLPEPYWGDPGKCSIAILNLNPGPVDKNVSKIFESYVSNSCYSNLAQQFPYYLSPSQLANTPLGGIAGRAGNKWWLNFKEWIVSLCGNNNPNNPLPFALELCPWHSNTWKINCVKKLNDPAFELAIQQEVINIFIYAIQNSTSGFGVCIGKQFGDILDHFGFTDISTNHPNYVPNCGVKLNNNICRYYRIYDKNGVKVLNTWSKGSNRRPGKHFWNAELNFIKQYIP